MQKILTGSRRGTKMHDIECSSESVSRLDTHHLRIRNPVEVLAKWESVNDASRRFAIAVRAACSVALVHGKFDGHGSSGGQRPKSPAATSASTRMQGKLHGVYRAPPLISIFCLQPMHLSPFHCRSRIETRVLERNSPITGNTKSMR